MKLRLWETLDIECWCQGYSADTDIGLPKVNILIVITTDIDILSFLENIARLDQIYVRYVRTYPPKLASFPSSNVTPIT